MMKQYPMNRDSRSEVDFDGSLWREPCPECGAAPFCWCRGKAGNRKGGTPHKARVGRSSPPSSDRRVPRGALEVKR